MKLRDLMAATLRFLQNDCAAYRVLWDWSPCVSQLLTSDIMVRGYVPAPQATPPRLRPLGSFTVHVRKEEEVTSRQMIA